MSIFEQRLLMPLPQSLFVGIVVPIRCDNANEFSIMHAFEHDLVNQLSQDFKEIAAMVSGYTTVKGIHLQVDATVCDENRILQTIYRTFRTLLAPRLGPGKQEVIEELARTKDYSLQCRRLERWMLRGGELLEDLNAERDCLLHLKEEQELQSLHALVGTQAIQIVVAGGRARVSGMATATDSQAQLPACVNFAWPTPETWSAPEKFSLFAIPSSFGLAVALATGLGPVCIEMERRKIPFALLDIGTHILLSLDRTETDLDAHSLLDIFKISLVANYKRHQTTLLEITMAASVMGRFIQESIMHHSQLKFGTQTIRELSGVSLQESIRAIESACQEIQYLAHNGKVPATLVKGELTCSAHDASGHGKKIEYEYTPESIALPSSMVKSQFELSSKDHYFASLAVFGITNNDFVHALKPTVHAFQESIFDIHKFSDHLLLEVFGIGEEIQPIFENLSRFTQKNNDKVPLAVITDYPWAMVALDLDGGVTQISGSKSLASRDPILEEFQKSIPKPSFEKEEKTGHEYLVKFDAPGLFAPDYDTHLALAHGLLHRCGWLAEEEKLSHVYGFLEVGLQKSYWGFRTTVLTSDAATADQQLKEGINRAITNHQLFSKRGREAMNIRHLDFYGGVRGRARILAQTLLSSQIKQQINPNCAFPPTGTYFRLAQKEWQNLN